MFVAFDPQPALEELPEVFPTPFRPGAPHALVERAARETQDFLRAHPWVEQEMFEGRFGGKMIGVLVLQHPDGRIGYLRGFAGRLGGPVEFRWVVDGFAPPAFDLLEFERIWGPGGAQVTAFDAEIFALRALESPSDAQQERIEQAVHAQRELSRSLFAQLHETYRISNARGETATLRALFEPHMPPGGAGDCAAPKLLAQAYELGARPLAMAEFWWGAPPPGGGRQHGVFYPACRGRCAKILPFMLEGIECEPPPDFGMKLVPDDAPRVVHEDDAIVVVDKPAGLLSVPGRGPKRQDSVEHRLQQRMQLSDPDGAWPRVAHRLDLATSGVLVAAKSRQTLIALQRQFSARRVEKRYVALVEGSVVGDRGTVELPLRRDFDDRPRQMHDPVDGKPSVTRWEVLTREPQSTRIALYPKTGRTHQLRLHAAHGLGLGTPIVGDWLYGFGGERLMLHAESIAFEHPTTGQPVRFASNCPF